MAARGGQASRRRGARGLCAERRGAAAARAARQRRDRALAVLVTGLGPLAVAAAAGPWCVGRSGRADGASATGARSSARSRISRRRSRTRSRAATRCEARWRRRPTSLEGPSAAELARVAADLELGASTGDALDGMREQGALGAGRLAVDGAAQPAGGGRRRGGADAAAGCGGGRARPGRRRGAGRHRPRRASPACWWSRCRRGRRCSPSFCSPDSSRGCSASPRRRRCWSRRRALQVVGFAVIRRLGRPSG